jgi:microcystin-dependent protein
MLNPQVIQAVQRYLTQFASTADFESSIESIYGTKIGSAAIRQQWLNGDFSLIPEISILSNGELGTANGAYAASLDEIFVSSDFLAQHQDDVAAVAGVLLEEIGHKLDRVFNGNLDTPGDEGAIFAAVAQGQDLSESQLQQLRSENDWATIELDGVPTSVELATTNTGAIGGNQSFDNRQPYAPHNYIIALQGIFPSRNLSNEPFLGAVEEFAGNFAPRGWALCDGRLLQINTNQALFALLGNTYGGNGQTTFALPDLRGRIPVGVGTGPGLTPIILGEQGGQENVTLATANLPAHKHTTSIQGVPTTENTGGGQSLDNRQPYLGLTPLIALQGIFPARNLGADEVIGGVSWFAGNFAPRGYAIADGSLLPISQNTALFSLLGTTYGGNGQTTFALPDLRGRTPIQAGQGPGLANIQLGEQGGSDGVTLGVNHLPAHAHTIAGQTDSGNTGGNVPFDNRQPYLGLNYEVSLFGIFPSQSLDDGSDPTNSGGVSPGASGLVAGQEILSDEVALQKINNLARIGLGLWQSVGLSPEQIAKLESATYKIANLDPGSLAFAGADDVVTIDTDASNRGWFVDETPGDNVEYGTTDPITKELYATDANALGHFDLLTAIVHEQGHILGFSHSSQLGSLMYGSLGTGGRRFPTIIDMVASSPTDTSSPSLSGTGDTVAGVSMFAGNFAPSGFASAEGQLLPIGQNDALFSLLGTTYGGNGQTNFALPDYRGRVAVGMGQGTGLANYSLGQVGGAATTTLSVTQIPAHAHSLIQPIIKTDFNGDGKSDILWRSDFGSVALWQMNGSTVVSASRTSIPTLASSWTVAGTGDFDGDGKSDILWRNTNGNVAVWTMDGSTVISSSLTSTPTLDNSWKTAGTGDFDGDGKSDILWRNTSGAVAVWTMNGSTVTSSTLTSTPSLDNSWKTAGTGDFNGDGTADILWRNDDGSIAIWQTNSAALVLGTTVISSLSTSTPKLDNSWKTAGTGDFNGDGKSDILWRNDDGSVALWQMNGANIISSSLTSTPSLDSSWKVAGVDDYNGDGKADILWRKDSGSLAVWQMNGSSIVSSSLTSIPADSNSWKIAAPIL